MEVTEMSHQKITEDDYFDIFNRGHVFLTCHWFTENNFVIVLF